MSISMEEFSYRLTRLRGNWAITFNDATTGKRRRHSLKTANRHEAERQAPSVFVTLTRPHNPVVDDLVAAYRQDKTGKHIAVQMVFLWRKLSQTFSGRQAETITIGDCRLYQALRRKQGMQEGTIRNELNHLRTVCNWAFKHGLIAKAPYIELPPATAPHHRHLTTEEVETLLRYVKSPHIRLAIFLMLSTAARITALLELTWDRVDMERGLINLAATDDKRRRKGRAIVPINKSLNFALREAYQVANSDFVIEWHGQRVRYIGVTLKSLGKLAGLKKTVTPHMFRHTAAVWMAEAGVSMPEISQYLGHSSTSITERVYARYSPDYLRKAASALEIKTEFRNVRKD